MGGVLVGQEVIQGGRVRRIISQQQDLTLAVLAFQDRYRAMPGDYALASTHLPCPGGCVNGDGDGKVDTIGAPAESLVAWSHLSAAGLLTSGFTVDAQTRTTSGNNTPRNAYGGYMHLAFDSTWGEPLASNDTRPRHNLKTGPGIPPSVLAEIDRKIDDGLPTVGRLQFSGYLSSDAAVLATGGTCLAGAVGQRQWGHGRDGDCGAATLF